LTANGAVRHQRAYYHCDQCGKGHCPFDDANGLRADRLSAGLRPLVCLAGILESFADGADDILRRFRGIRLSAATTRRVTAAAGQRLQQRQRHGDIVRPTATRRWDFRLAGQSRTVAYLGLDAFSVPMQQSGGAAAEGRLLYTAVIYTPDKEHHHYLVDFDLDRLAGQLRQAASALGLSAVEKLIAITDAGNGLEAALRRHFTDDLLCILDWYHASQHLYGFAGHLYPQNPSQRAAWCEKAKAVLYEQGGQALVAYLQNLPVPADALAADELRKLVNYFADNVHRTAYPEYRGAGWDIGSGPTEAACKVVGSRLKQSGMRWLEAGAATVAPLRALYQSGPEAWDAFWALAA
jgi:hypothetical protein